jgi:hypothetical protein
MKMEQSCRTLQEEMCQTIPVSLKRQCQRSKGQTFFLFLFWGGLWFMYIHNWTVVYTEDKSSKPKN